MHANHPDMAKRWERDTPRGKHLPKHKRKKARKKHGRKK